MDAQFAEQPHTVRGAAPTSPDPRMVVTPLNPVLVEELLRELGILQQWEHVVDGLRNGFHVGADAPIASTTLHRNHSSSEIDPEFIDSYISQEQAAGRYSRAFSPDELEQIIGPFRTSPLGLVPKPHSDKMRLIQDMSYPRNNPNLPSVNASINSDDFPTEWGTFSQTAEMILSLPPGCMAATFDITAAYRITPIRPLQQNALCIFWKGKVYVDRAVMFGLSSSAGVFGSVADMLVAIYRALHFGPMKKWVDDFFVVRLPQQTWTESDFIDVTARLGVPWSLQKTRTLSSRQRFIGFDWDLTRKSVCLPPDKRSSILSLVASWSSSEATFSMKEAASFHGKLVHVSLIYPLIRPFLSSITHFQSTFLSHRARLHPPSRLIADLTWVRYIINQLPNELPLSHSAPVDIQWWGDASTSFGIGVVVSVAESSPVQSFAQILENWT